MVRTNLTRVYGTFVFAAASLLAGPVQSAPVHAVELKVIHATTAVKAQMDPKLKSLASQLKKLPFNSYRLKDRTMLRLKDASKGSVQLPGGEWVEIKALGLGEDKKRLRLRIEIGKNTFKATVAIAAGARVVLKGPRFQGGTLVLVLTRANMK